MKRLFLFILLLLGTTCFAQSVYTVTSPDQKIVLSCDMNSNTYTVAYSGQMVLRPSKLGIVRADEDFSKGLKTLAVSKPTLITDSYTMVNAKTS